MWVSTQTVESLATEGTNAHRVATTHGYFIDRFDDAYLISLRGNHSSKEAHDRLAQWAIQTSLTIRTVYVRRLAASALQTEPATLVEGSITLNGRTVAKENGDTYGIDFSAGQSSGLFVDQRENRKFLQRLRPQCVLNCFAYTCAFSVSAARAGARTLSVDLSKKWLDRGKENFALNGIALQDHRFYADDVRTVFRRLNRRDERFDVIILDPPTFARVNGSVFRVERDFSELVESALGCLGNQGHILLSTNCTRWREEDLKALAIEAAARQQRHVAFFRTDPPADIPEFGLPASVWARFTSRVP